MDRDGAEAGSSKSNHDTNQNFRPELHLGSGGVRGGAKRGLKCGLA